MILNKVKAYFCKKYFSGRLSFYISDISLLQVYETGKNIFEYIVYEKYQVKLYNHHEFRTDMAL